MATATTWSGFLPLSASLITFFPRPPRLATLTRAQHSGIRRPMPCSVTMRAHWPRPSEGAGASSSPAAASASASPPPSAAFGGFSPSEPSSASASASLSFPAGPPAFSGSFAAALLSESSSSQPLLAAFCGAFGGGPAAAAWADPPWWSSSSSMASPSSSWPPFSSAFACFSASFFLILCTSWTVSCEMLQYARASPVPLRIFIANIPGPARVFLRQSSPSEHRKR
mmetsp:Transcript_19179/g.50461  ORF Transcript_19179/g.50461 Transcript_19179/m.50461 type:complete len:226 (-) Transcript_19179:1440-2117(-)